MSPVEGASVPPAEEETGWRRILNARFDETILRFMFRGLVALTILVLGYDLVERMNAPEPPAIEQPEMPDGVPDLAPYLPSARPGVEAPQEKRQGRAPKADLRKPMTLELVSGGRLEARGAITPGTAARLAAELDKRGDYVKTVVLNSPGGSVRDALEMGRMIRARGLATRVEANGLCASSCPLVFAGGTARVAEAGSAIGVHQVFAVRPAGGAPALDGPQGMARAQAISAECQRHLVGLGVDARVWMHAMETPPQAMFYFTPAELTDLKLASARS